MVMRRMMMGKGSNPITPATLVYELAEPTNTNNFNTGIRLLENPHSFSILIEAYFNNYGWTSAQAICGVSPSNNVTSNKFHLGTCRLYTDMQSGVVFANSTNRFTAIAMNGGSDKKCSSLSARTDSYITKRYVITYDHSTGRIQAWSSDSPNNNNRWWIVTGDVTTSYYLKLNCANAGSTVNVFKLYDGVISAEEINEFLTGI